MSYTQTESTFGERLQYARKKRKLTQKELARKLKVSTGTIYNLEHDRASLKKEKVLRICRFLNIKYSWLMNNVGYIDDSTIHSIDKKTTDSADVPYLQDIQNDMAVMKIYSRLVSDEDKRKAAYSLYNMFQDKYDLSDIKRNFLPNII